MPSDRLPWEQDDISPEKPPESSEGTSFNPEILDPSVVSSERVLSPGYYRILAQTDSNFSGERPSFGSWIQASELVSYRLMPSDASSNGIYFDIKISAPIPSATTIIPQQVAVPSEWIDDLIRAGVLTLPRLNPWIAATMATAGVIYYVVAERTDEDVRERTPCPILGPRKIPMVLIPGTVDLCIGQARGGDSLDNFWTSLPKQYEGFANKALGAIPAKIPEEEDIFFGSIVDLFRGVWVVNKTAQQLDRAWRIGVEFDGYIESTKEIVDAKCWKRGGAFDYRGTMGDRARDINVLSDSEIQQIDPEEILLIEGQEDLRRAELFLENPLEVLQQIRDVWTSQPRGHRRRNVLDIAKRQLRRQAEAIGSSPTVSKIVWAMPTDEMVELYEQELQEDLVEQQGIFIPKHVTFRIKKIDYKPCR
jgi:hypothetical protein